MAFRISKAFLICSFVLTFLAEGTPIFGRYVGVLKHEKTKKEQLAKLDFIVSRNNKDEMELRAVFSLHFGDFKSGEYVSYHYDNVRYSMASGALTFTNSDQPISIFVKKFKAGSFVGNVTSIWAGRVGELVLSQEKSVKPSSPLISPIWGEYKGKCDETPAKLTLYTLRSSGDLAHLAQPFATYKIVGNLAYHCVDGSCINFAISEGSYNFFNEKEQLNLISDLRTFRCDVEGDSLECRSPDEADDAYFDLRRCSFRRSSNETQEPLQLSPLEYSGTFASEILNREIGADEFKSLKSGEYKGYVFHEYLGKYQAANLTIDVFQAGSGEEGGTRVSSSVRLFFGDFGSPEVIPYRFSEFIFPSLKGKSQSVVLQKMAGDMDAVLKISRIEPGIIKGVWYSLIFGRVGPFELRENSLPQLPKDARKIERLSGVYRGTETLIRSYPKSQWLLRLQVASGVKPPNTSENPFFPNTIKGSVMLEPITAALKISDASFDFYTGRFGIVSPWNGRDLVWVGNQETQRELRLTPVGRANLSPAPIHKPEKYSLVGEFK